MDDLYSIFYSDITDSVKHTILNGISARFMVYHVLRYFFICYFM